MAAKNHNPERPAETDPTPGRPLSSPTSLDVARLANVSRATVSYVLNDVPNSRISDATKERVRKAAATLGYVPHEMASSLRAGRRDLVLLPFFDWPYNQSSISFLQELALQIDALGYAVMVRLFRRSDKTSTARKIASFHPVGMIVLADELSQADIEILSKNGVRAILAYGGVPSVPIPSVKVDFSSVGECAGHHFVSQGHRRVAVIVPKDARITYLGLQRLEGVKRVGSQFNLEIDRIDLDFDTGQAAQLAAQWKQGPRPTAVFTYNDEYGLLLMSALQDAGLNIPGDVALAGCDDLPFCELLRPRLTSIDISSDSPVREIAAYFDNLIQGREISHPLLIPAACRLVVRESG